MHVNVFLFEQRKQLFIHLFENEIRKSHIKTNKMFASSVTRKFSETVCKYINVYRSFLVVQVSALKKIKISV